MELQDLKNTIIQHPLFQRLDAVVENSAGWHDHEKTHDHCLKTARIAEREVEGNFITNSHAKKLFLSFMDRDIGGIKQKEISILAGLLHDCGKILSYKEEGTIKTMLAPAPNKADTTMFPGHEYFGGTIVAKEILKDIPLSNVSKVAIQTVITLHGVYNNTQYYTEKEGWNIETIISDVKTRAMGNHIAALFNSYCDCYDATAFASSKAVIEKLFNQPSLYLEREYFIS